MHKINFYASSHLKGIDQIFSSGVLYKGYKQLICCLLAFEQPQYGKMLITLMS